MRKTAGCLTVLGAILTSALALTLQQNPQQLPTFRTSTELVLIDTQVVARDGTPVQGMKANQFEVFIDGRKRPVVSVELVRATTAAAAAPESAAAVAPGAPPLGRTIVLAVDQGSFPVTAQEAAREAARRVVDRVAVD